MGEQLQFLARCLIGGLCSLVLFCTSCRHAPLRASSVRAPVETVTHTAGHVGAYHEVKQGETLWGIARAYGVDVQTLTRVNRLSDATVLYPGHKLYVPGATQQRDIVSRCPCGMETPKSSSSPKRLTEIFRPLERSSVA